MLDEATAAIDSETGMIDTIYVNDFLSLKLPMLANCNFKKMFFIQMRKSRIQYVKHLKIVRC